MKITWVISMYNAEKAYNLPFLSMEVLLRGDLILKVDVFWTTNQGKRQNRNEIPATA